MEATQTDHGSATALRPTLRWLYSFLLPERASLIGLLVLSLLVSTAVLAQPYVTKLIIDDGLLAQNYTRLLGYSLLLLLVGVAASLLSGYNRLRYTTVSSRILFALRESVYAHLTRLPPDFFARRRLGDLASRLDRDVAQLQRFAVDTLFSSISSLLGLAGTLGMMLYLNWQLSLALLVLIPMEVVVLRWLRPRVHARNRALRERSADIASFLTETLPAMKFIQSSGAEQRETTRLAGLNQRFATDLLALQKTEWAAAAIPSLLVTCTRALVFLLGGLWVIQGKLALGSLVAFSAYLAMAFNPVQSLLGLYLSWHRMLVSLERVHVLRCAEPEPEPAHARKVPAGLRGEITLENLAYSNHHCELRDVHLHLQAGARLSLNGPSGSGKSTLLDLIQRHITPSAGRILMDGQNIADFQRHAWRRHIAVVAQEAVIFSDTLANNLRYCRADASETQVRDVAEKSGLATLIARLPRGLDTVLSERGSALSGGERQRIALARALLQRPSLLILDESTSALEPELEAQLLSTIDKLFPQTTLIVVSHRPSPALYCDVVATIENQTLKVSSVATEDVCAVSVSA